MRPRRKREGSHQTPRFTEGDRRVAVLVRDGLANPEIAAILVIEIRSVEARVNRLYRFFSIDDQNRVKLALTIAAYLGAERDPDDEAYLAGLLGDEWDTSASPGT